MSRKANAHLACFQSIEVAEIATTHRLPLGIYAHTKGGERLYGEHFTFLIRACSRPASKKTLDEILKSSTRMLLELHWCYCSFLLDGALD